VGSIEGRMNKVQVSGVGQFGYYSGKVVGPKSNARAGRKMR